MANLLPESSRWLSDVALTENLFYSATASLVRYSLLELKLAWGHVGYSMLPYVQDVLKKNMSKDEWREMVTLAIKSIGHETS
jgi:hypothetical protein